MSKGWQSWQSGWQSAWQRDGQGDGQGKDRSTAPQLQLWWGQAPTPKKPAAEVAPTTPMRIGDAERDTAVSDLGDHFAAGRLSREEFDERADQAIQARFSTDLAPLFADLPTSLPAPPPTAPPTAAGPPPWAYMMWLFPVLLVAAVAGAVLLHAPFVLWFVVWMLVIGRLTGHTHRYRREQQQRGVSRPGPH